MNALEEVNQKIEQTKVAVNVDHVCVEYRSYKDQPTTLKDGILQFIKTGKIKYHSKFQALDNISFEVSKGEIFGIIGSNGAGKSTLLSVLAGVLPPTSGSYKINGSVDSLRTLGAGFDSELNALENIYLYGALHGSSRAQIKERIPHILEFAELEEFATTPVKYYSSGMYARLGFSVAIDKNPEVLIIDEVLAVGDERFQRKCKTVFEDYLAKGKTIIIVSHSMEVVQQICTRIALLSQGRIIYTGSPTEAIKRYQDPTYQTRLK